MSKITEEEIKEILPLKGPSFEEVKNYLEKYNDEYVVIKCGGSVLVDQKLFHNFINDISILNKLGFIPIIIHGGGKRISNKLNEMGLKKSVLVCGLTYKANVEDMRDSPSLKIVQEMEKKGFTIYGYDPFFDSKILKKYLIENQISELNFQNLKNLDDKSIKEISCLCIVQHHDEVKIRIKEIYDKSLIPFIYDCQSKLIKNSQSNSKIDYLGN